MLAEAGVAAAQSSNFFPPDGFNNKMAFETMDVANNSSNNEYMHEPSRQLVNGNARAKSNLVVRTGRDSAEGHYTR